MFYSVAYYPEHTNAKQIDVDIELMKKAGINTIRTAEFAWSLLEPEENVYNFKWLDEAIEKLGKAGIKTVIGTPTAIPPKWLIDKYPSVCQTKIDGSNRGYGGRRNACINSKIFLDYSVKITKKIAEHYKENKNVIAYQIDNELMAEEPYCYCAECQKKFQNKMKEKYSTLENLNDEWGLNFWSLNFYSWDSIEIPKPNNRQPSALKNYYEFASDCYVEFCDKMTEIIRDVDSKKPITHNICSSGYIFRMDLEKLFKNLDVTSLDLYPSYRMYYEYRVPAKEQFSLCEMSFALALTRAYKKSHFWITEKATPNLLNVNQFLPLSMLEFAHGSRMFSAFEWRKLPFGAEQGHPSLLSYDSVPRKSYNLFCDMIKLFESIKETEKALPVADVAMIRDFQSDFIFMANNSSSKTFTYQTYLYEYYKAVVFNNTNCDIIMADDDFSKYKVVIAPAFAVIDEDRADKIKKFVNNGGVYVTTQFSSFLNRENVCREEIQPCLLSDFAGIEIEDTYGNIDSINITDINGDNYTAGIAVDIVQNNTADTVAVFNHKNTEDTPAITVKNNGSGKMYYFACLPEYKYLKKLFSEIFTYCEIESDIICNNDNVEIVKNSDGENLWYFIVNYNNSPVTLEIKKTMTDIIANTSVNDCCELPAMGYIVLKD